MLGGRAEDVCDLVDLVEVVLAREGRPVAHHLGQAAAHSPHVHALGVALKKKKTLFVGHQYTLLSTYVFSKDYRVYTGCPIVASRLFKSRKDTRTHPTHL